MGKKGGGGREVVSGRSGAEAEPQMSPDLRTATCHLLRSTAAFVWRAELFLPLTGFLRSLPSGCAFRPLPPPQKNTWHQVTMIGVAFTDDHIATGYGSFLVRPLLRTEHRPDMSLEEAVLLLEKGLRVLFARDSSFLNKFQVGSHALTLLHSCTRSHRVASLR